MRGGSVAASMLSAYALNEAVQGIVGIVIFGIGVRNGLIFAFYGVLLVVLYVCFSVKERGCHTPRAGALG